MRVNYLLVLLLITFSNNYLLADVRLPQIVRDSMILQRNSKVRIWGWASPKEKIKIDFLKRRYSCVSDAKGNWVIILSPMVAGGPFAMKINAKNHIVLSDILIGDVWLCSGQSNMVHQMELHKYTYAKDIAEANYSEI